MNIYPHVQRWLDLLPIVADKGWETDEFGIIREKTDRGRGPCPICALANEVEGGNGWVVWACFAAQKVFGEDHGVMTIVEAADDPNHPLRPALMQALGMTK